ncbi:MAG: 30S ribosomal protein S18 [Ruminococcaceae bacterium]|nr:30S ribosomal protein S18 [Oscillospiraceae bacterium]
MDTEKTVDTEVVAEVVAEEVKAEATEVEAAPAAENAERREYTKPQRQNNRKRKKVCAFCAEKIDEIDYKDTLRLRKYTSERAKILPRRVTGTCAKHQRQLTIAIKRARQVALMPYIAD